MYFRPPARRRRLIPRTLIIIIAAAAAGAFILLYFLGVIPSFGFLGNVHELDFSLPETVSASKNGILYNQNDTLHLIDTQGKESWSLNLELTEAKTETSEELIVNYASKTMQVMSYTKEQMFNTSLDSEILDTAAGVKTVAALTNTPNEAGTSANYIHLFNLSGEPTGQIDYFAAWQVIDFGFYGDSDMFWVLALNSGGVVPESIIATFKPDGSLTTNISVNTELIEQVYVTDSSIYTSGTNNLSSYTYFSVLQAEQQIYGWHPAAVSLQPQAMKLALAPRSRSAEIDAARIYSEDLSNVHVRLPRNVFSLAVTQGRLYAFTAGSVYVYTLDGVLDKQIPLDSEIVKAKQVSDTCAILWSNQKSYVMNLS